MTGCVLLSSPGGENCLLLEDLDVLLEFAFLLGDLVLQLLEELDVLGCMQLLILDLLEVLLLLLVDHVRVLQRFFGLEIDQLLEAELAELHVGMGSVVAVIVTVLVVWLVVVTVVVLASRAVFVVMLLDILFALVLVLSALFLLMLILWALIMLFGEAEVVGGLVEADSLSGKLRKCEAPLGKKGEIA
jgi:hypothetical protein